MQLDLPKHLQSTQNLLAQSLQLHHTEQAPAIPEDLFSDLAKRFNQAPSMATPGQSRSWFEVVQSFIARPAFGMAALATVILGISVPTMLNNRSHRSNEVFRGAVSSTAESGSVKILLINEPAGIRQLLENSGDFEAGMISSSQRIEASTKGTQILVNFDLSTISVLDANGAEIHSTPMPADNADLSAAIAAAISRL